MPRELCCFCPTHRAPLVPYDGALGYESFVCPVCGWDVNELQRHAPHLYMNLEQLDRLIRQFIKGDLVVFPTSALHQSAESLALAAIPRGLPSPT